MSKTPMSAEQKIQRELTPREEKQERKVNALIGTTDAVTHQVGRITWLAGTSSMCVLEGKTTTI